MIKIEQIVIEIIMNFFFFLYSLISLLLSPKILSMVYINSLFELLSISSVKSIFNFLSVITTLSPVLIPELDNFSSPLNSLIIYFIRNFLEII